MKTVDQLTTEINNLRREIDADKDKHGFGIELLQNLRYSMLAQLLTERAELMLDKSPR